MVMIVSFQQSKYRCIHSKLQRCLTFSNPNTIFKPVSDK
jgi:hypothetical protein